MKCRAIIGMMLMTLLASCSDDKPGAEVEKEVGVTYSLSAVANPTEGGSVTPQQGNYKAGTKLSIKATPNADYVFTGWSGSSTSEDNPLSLTVSGNVNLTANFKLREYPLSLTIEGEGTVKETVVSTRSDYAVGTVVKLTAVPDEGWQFKEWQGDISGTENSVNITISSSKSVKAVFIKQHFSYKINIIGPGVVDEEIVQTRALEYGTVLQLTAVLGNDKAVFKGWSGSVSGTDNVISIPLTKDIEINAEFLNINDDLKYPLPDLMQPWYKLKNSHIGIDFSRFSYSSYQHLVVDYNRDGYLDVITALYDGYGSLDRKFPIGFYLGQPDGSFKSDEKNDKRFEGLIHIRKMMYGDYNDDGYPDICLLGHGYDIDPWGGEYPIILMSSPSGIFKENRYTDYVSFYHGGSQGDFDNDGDLDIFILGNFGHSALMINDGWGNFTIDESKVNPDLFVSMFNTEFYDLDHDGYLDLIMGGHDWEDDSYYHGGDTSYSNTPIVIWGNGITFNTDDYVRLPETNNEGFGIVCDYYFKDLNNDGNDEIILSRTGDGVRGGVSFYYGWSIQILECKGRDFKDVTSLYFDNLNDTYQNDRKDYGWIVWLDIQEINGINCLIGCFDTPDTPTPKALFEFSGGKFTRIKGIDIVKPSQGLLLYADSYNINQAGNSVGSSLLNTSSNDYPYLGTGSIHIKDTWHDYFDVGFAFPYYVDFTNLIEQNYYLEFFIKNSDPSLMLEIKIETESGYYIEEPPRYFYNLSTEDIHHDGTWEAVRIPLNDFSIWNAPANDNHWNKIKKISIIPVSEKKKELFLDEIRIRKIADINN